MCLGWSPHKWTALGTLVHTWLNSRLHVSITFRPGRSSVWPQSDLRATEQLSSSSGVKGLPFIFPTQNDPVGPEDWMGHKLTSVSLMPLRVATHAMCRTQYFLQKERNNLMLICQLCKKTQIIENISTKFMECFLTWSVGTFSLGDKKPWTPKLVTVLFQNIDIVNHPNIVVFYKWSVEGEISLKSVQTAAKCWLVKPTLDEWSSNKLLQFGFNAKLTKCKRNEPLVCIQSLYLSFQLVKSVGINTSSVLIFSGKPKNINYFFLLKRGKSDSQSGLHTL